MTVLMKAKEAADRVYDSIRTKVDLASLKDFELKRQYSDKLSSLISEIGELKSKTLQISRNRIMQ